MEVIFRPSTSVQTSDLWKKLKAVKDQEKAALKTEIKNINKGIGVEGKNIKDAIEQAKNQSAERCKDSIKKEALKLLENEPYKNWCWAKTSIDVYIYSSTEESTHSDEGNLREAKKFLLKNVMPKEASIVFELVYKESGREAKKAATEKKVGD